MRPEEKIEKAFCKKLFEIYDLEAYKFNVKKGSPDRIMFLPQGITLFIEFKRPGGQTNWHQDEFISGLREKQHTVAICDNVENALNFVKKHYKVKI